MNRADRRRARHRDERLLRLARKCLEYCGLPGNPSRQEVRDHVNWVAEELRHEGIITKRELRELKLWHKAQAFAEARVEARKKALKEAQELKARSEFAIDAMQPEQE